MRVVFADQLGHLGEAYGGWWLKNSNDVFVNDVADAGKHSARCWVFLVFRPSVKNGKTLLT